VGPQPGRGAVACAGGGGGGGGGGDAGLASLAPHIRPGAGRLGF
jgi:hypothetical protein